MSAFFESLSKTEQNYLVVSCIKGIGIQTLSHLHQNHALEALHEWDEQAFRDLGISPKRCQLLVSGLKNPMNKTLEQALHWQQAHPHNHLITPVSDSYPERLKHIASPPMMLMVKGQLNALLAPQIAVVGSRHPSFQGRHEAYEFSAALAHSGLVITSGLAKGVDTQAHQGALDANASTIAVLGSGFHHIYPKENIGLAEQVCEKGALISEFPLHSRPATGHFPKRNRIVSGLSLGVLVIEAHLKSGSLITARQALEQNREVFAIPGNVGNAQKGGCHYLIRQGAILVESPDQVLMDLQSQIQIELRQGNVIREHDQSHHSKAQQTDSSSGVPLDMQPEHYQIYRHLDHNGVSIEQLMGHTGLSVSKLNELLLEMELNQWVCNEKGLFFRQTRVFV